MTPEDRRTAIVEAVLPLVVSGGSMPSTREIADAAGVAEGTIYRVFEDKGALCHALAEHALDPPEVGDSLLVRARAETDLPARVAVVAGLLQARMRTVTAVMMVVREQMMRETTSGLRHDARPGGPPAYVVRANQQLLARLVEVFEIDREHLRVDPETAAMVLRSIVFGSLHPGMTATRGLSAAQVADVVIHGVAATPSTTVSPDPEEILC